MYFNDFDYEAFAPENVSLNTQAVRQRRKGIQEKLLDINDDIKSILEKQYNLYPHHKKEHITSLLYPCEYNKGMVHWICMRYGRNHEIFKDFARNKEENYLGFQKYNNFQISIYETGVDMGMYHSVPYNSYDRDFVREKLKKGDKEFKVKLINAVEQIQKYNYKFKVNSEGGFEENFYFKNYSKEEVGQMFIEFYEENCIEGRYSAILSYYPKADERIETQEKIEHEFLMHIEQIMPIFNALSWIC